MHKSQANRSVIAQRALVNAARVPGRPATDLLARVQTEAQASGNYAIRRTRVSRKGQAGPWSEPQYLHPCSTAMTAAWSRTMSS